MLLACAVPANPRRSSGLLGVVRGDATLPDPVPEPTEATACDRPRTAGATLWCLRTAVLFRVARSAGVSDKYGVSSDDAALPRGAVSGAGLPCGCVRTGGRLAP